MTCRWHVRGWSAKRITRRGAERITRRSAERITRRSAKRITRWSAKRITRRGAERITRRGAEGGRVTAPDFGIRSCVPWKNLLLFYRKKKLSPGIQTAEKQLMTSADRRGTGFFDTYKRTTHRRNGL